MLDESKFKALDTSDTVPFPVDFKEFDNNRLFKHLSFPGEQGTFRIKTVTTGLNHEGMTLVKKVNTNVADLDVNEQRYRIRAILSAPDTGVTESHWLTLNHHHYDQVQAHNQYRSRGISLEGWKSDWVYSEARTEDNHIIIFELLHDFLDIVSMIQDDDLQTMFSYTIQDAYANIIKQNDPRHIFNREESEEISVQMQMLFSKIASVLNHEFKDFLSAGFDEDSTVWSLYKLRDSLKLKAKEGLVALFIEQFLEDRLEKVIQKAQLEVLVENEGNKALFLEGSYNLEIKNEILRSAYLIMPHDNFVSKLNSTVKLLVEPAFDEVLHTEILDRSRNALTQIKKDIGELLKVEVSEYIHMLAQILLEDVYLPMVLVDQRAGEYLIDLHDKIEKADIQDPLVQYDLYDGDSLLKTMIVRDVFKEIVRGDLPLRHDFEAHFIDKVVNRIDEKTSMVISYNFHEFCDAINSIGENFRQSYMAMQQVAGDVMVVLPEDTLQVLMAPGANVSDQMLIGTEDAAETQTIHRTAVKDDFMLEAIETIIRGALMDPILENEQLGLSADEHETVAPGLQHRLGDYFKVIATDRTALKPDGSLPIGETIAANFTAAFHPVYKPYLRDKIARVLRDHEERVLFPDLHDKYELVGRDKVLYALGDMSADGWPVGTFVLGVNTLKGVSN